MTGTMKIKDCSSGTKRKHYKQWVEETQGKSLQEYFDELIDQKLDFLKKQEGRCNQYSIRVQKGKYRGSCVWDGRHNSYCVVIRFENKMRRYGYFQSLYSAERELRRFFKIDEKDLWDEAKKQQKYHTESYRKKTRPRLTDDTNKIQMIRKSGKGVQLVFYDSFINPLTNEKQKTILWVESWFEHYSKQDLLNECVLRDDPVEIIHYRELLRERLKQYKPKEKEKKNNKKEE